MPEVILVPANGSSYAVEVEVVEPRVSPQSVTVKVKIIAVNQ